MNLELYPPQMRALTSEATEILYGGAAGGGKSHLVRVASIFYSLAIPGLVTYVFRRTFPEVMSNHVHTPNGYLELLHPLLDSGECVFSRSDFTFTFKNGSRINLAHCQHEDDVSKYLGAQIGLLIVDECTSFTPKMVRFLRTRVRLGSMRVPDEWRDKFPRILYTTNPGGVGHHYFKSQFVDFGAGRVHWASDEDGGMLREYIPAKLSDNAVMMENDPNYGKRLAGLGDPTTVRALLDGDWNIVMTGGLTDVWDASKCVVDPFDIPHTWKISRGYDYGSSSPAAAVWFAEADGEAFTNAKGEEAWCPKGTVFVIGELYLANDKLEGLRLTAREQAKRIRKWEDDRAIHWRVKPGPADNTIFSSEPGVRAVIDDMAKEGIMFTKAYKGQGSRVSGLQIMRTMLMAAKARPMEHPGLIVFSSCHHVIRTLPNLQPCPNNPEDIFTKQEDHLYDVIRYFLLAIARAPVISKVIGI